MVEAERLKCMRVAFGGWRSALVTQTKEDAESAINEMEKTYTEAKSKMIKETEGDRDVR
tara:strand:+ start:752 stop:928 length:177 start_codon:yes stop_codon:yes gene_type:complete